MPSLVQRFVLALLLAWLYAPVLQRLVIQWWQDPNFSHGFFVPLFSAYILWRLRPRLGALPVRPTCNGILVIALGLAILIIGSLGAELFLSRISLLIVFAGLVLALAGRDPMRAILFPWAFLFLMIPIPAILFNQITFPLQLLASKIAATLLPFANVPVLREGNIIRLPAMSLEVAEACSGIRSLMSLVTLAIIYGYFAERNPWARVALAITAIPIAVMANSLRIVGTGLVVQYGDAEKAAGFFHTFSGWLIFAVSLSLLLIVHRSFRLISGKNNSSEAVS